MTGVEASNPDAAPAPGDVLVGAIVGYGCVVTVNSPPPDGWLLCDGSAVSRSRYAGLFDVIGRASCRERV